MERFTLKLTIIQNCPFQRTDTLFSLYHGLRGDCEDQKGHSIVFCSFLDDECVTKRPPPPFFRGWAWIHPHLVVHSIQDGRAATVILITQKAVMCMTKWADRYSVYFDQRYGKTRKTWLHFITTTTTAVVDG